MIQNVLRHLGGIEGYGVLSLCLFIAAFGVVVFRALLQRQSDLDRMAMLPLEEGARGGERVKPDEHQTSHQEKPL